jgi:hypothetical protein
MRTAPTAVMIGCPGGMVRTFATTTQLVQEASHGPLARNFPSCRCDHQHDPGQSRSSRSPPQDSSPSLDQTRGVLMIGSFTGPRGNIGLLLTALQTAAVAWASPVQRTSGVRSPVATGHLPLASAGLAQGCVMDSGRTASSNCSPVRNPRAIVDSRRVEPSLWAFFATSAALS